MSHGRQTAGPSNDKGHLAVGAAAIVVGSRGLGGIRARLEGSTSKGLLKHASCPVLVVHETEEGHD